MPTDRPRALLLDLLMATMNSLEVWSAAAGDDPERGLRWRDAVTARMVAAGRYVAYGRLVREEAVRLGLPASAPSELEARWPTIAPWPDAATLAGLDLPLAFVTNASAALAEVAARRSGLQPAFTLSAEEAGWYKPRPEIYAEACRRIGRPANEVLFVAGSPYDALGAHRAGLRAVLVRRRPEHDAPDPAIPVIATLTEIATRRIRNAD
jgi:2-haloacid dehalogenase